MRALYTFILILLLTTRAFADDHAEAFAHFQRGLELVDKKQWADALAEFERSRALEPTRTALKNAAMCLRELGRYDEALDAYDDLERTYASALDAAERAAIDADALAMGRYIGEVDVTGPAGASVSIDGRARGTLPLSKPARAVAGTRVVRVDKPGLASFTETVTIIAGEKRSVAARLSASAEVGHLVVRERTGKVVDVRVDSAAVGRTPWEGDVSAGEHAVTLRGDGDMGTEPRAVVVRTGTREELTLDAIALPGELHVETTPLDARVRIDGKPSNIVLGARGEITSGEHTIDVDAPWYEPQSLKTVVSSREPRTLRVVLEPIPRAFVDGIGGIVTFPTYSTPISCSLLSCLGYMIGVRAGYAFTRRFNAEIFLMANMSVVRTNATSSASIFLSYGGVSASYRPFDFPFKGRLWIGGGRGQAYVVFWTPVVGLEATVTWQASKNIALEFGLAAMGFLVPTVANAFDGGVGAAFPLTITVHASL